MNFGWYERKNYVVFSQMKTKPDCIGTVWKNHSCHKSSLKKKPHFTALTNETGLANKWLYATLGLAIRYPKQISDIKLLHVLNPTNKIICANMKDEGWTIEMAYGIEMPT